MKERDGEREREIERARERERQTDRQRQRAGYMCYRTRLTWSYITCQILSQV